MWRDVVLTIITVALLPTLALLLKIAYSLWVFQEYPPHRHEGKKIFYPKGMSPGRMQELEEDHKTAGA